MVEGKGPRVQRQPCRQLDVAAQLRRAYRYGETISTVFAESGINQVISKCTMKKQQMR